MLPEKHSVFLCAGKKYITEEVENEFMDSWFDIPDEVNIDNIAATDLDIDEVVEVKQ